MRRPFRVIVSVAFSAGGLWWASRGLDVPQAAAAVRGMEGAALWLLVPAAMAVEFLCRSVRWGALLAGASPGRGRLFAITSGGFFLNNILPFRAGEAARLFWTCRDAGRPVPFVAAVLGVDRLLDVMALATLFCFVSLSWGAFPLGGGVFSVLGTAAAAGTALLWAAVRRPEKAVGLAEKAGLRGRARGWFEDFIRGAAVLSNPASFLGLYAVSLLFWTVNAALLAATSRAFGLDLTWMEGAALILAFALGASLPSAPGYIGVLEAAGVALLDAAGKPRSTTVPFVMVFHLAQIASSAFYGVPGLAALQRGARDA